MNAGQLLPLDLNGHYILVLVHISIGIWEEPIRVCVSASVGVLTLTSLLVLASVLAVVLGVVCILIFVLALLLT